MSACFACACASFTYALLRRCYWQVGRSLASLSAGPEIDIETLLDRCRDATAADMASGLIKAEVLFKHRFLDPVPVDVTLGLAGEQVRRWEWRSVAACVLG